MYSPIELAFKYLNHLRLASSGKGHGIHSPFVYEFVSEVLNDNRNFYPFEAIEGIRSELLRDQRMIEVEDYGKSSGVTGCRKIARIARRSLSTEKFGRLLFRIVNHYQPKHMVELGTSLGISGAYLAAANPASALLTLEGSPFIAQRAGETFSKLGLNNVRQITGNFDDTLEAVIGSAPPTDLLYIDGNHRKEPLLKYFGQFLNKRSPDALFILHDIHWSRGMEEAWQIISDHPETKLTMDLFSAGLIFFKDSFLVKQHFSIRF